MSCIGIRVKKLMEIANFFVRFILVCIFKPAPSQQQQQNTTKQPKPKYRKHKQNPKIPKQSWKEPGVSFQLPAVAGSATRGGFQPMQTFAS